MSPRVAHTVDEVRGAVAVMVEVTREELMATTALADFGIEQGVRLVPVRIVERLGLVLRIETALSVPLAEPPRLCLVGPYWAPDDAGLSDRCWGEPDLGELLVAQLAPAGSGGVVLSPHEPIELIADLYRGDERCDYPPGTWQLEVGLKPVIDGRTTEPVDLPPVSLPVPPVDQGPLRMDLFDTRYCGLATVVYLEQGEPPIATP